MAKKVKKQKIEKKVDKKEKKVKKKIEVKSKFVRGHSKYNTNAGTKIGAVNV